MKGQFELGLPILELNLENKKIKVMLDTGFNGELMLPDAVISKLALEPIAITDYMTASGDNYFTQVFKGMLKIFNEEKEVTVLATSTGFSLAGLQLFHLCKVTLERHKGILEIEKTG